MDVIPERFPVADPDDNLISLSKKGRREQFPMVSAGKGIHVSSPGSCVCS